MGIVAVVAMSVLWIGAASASAHEFESSGGATRGAQVGIEEFVVYPMKVNCQHAVAKGSAPSGKFVSYTTEIKSSSCTTFNGGVKVAVSPAQWQYNAEGTEALLNEVTIRPIGLGCHYSVPPQSAFTKQSVLFEDGVLPANLKFPEGQKKLTIYSKLQGLTYTAFGWPCTGPKSAKELGEEHSETSEGEGGLFVGGNHEETVGGNLTWIE
jgi:hypothetical protein